MLMLGAFLAGLLAVAVALLVPGRQPESPFSQPLPAPMKLGQPPPRVGFLGAAAPSSGFAAASPSPSPSPLRCRSMSFSLSDWCPSGGSRPSVMTMSGSIPFA